MTQARLIPARLPSTRLVATLVVSLLALASSSLRAQQAEPRFLAKEQIILYGIGLQAQPARQVVPRDIATIVSTFLQAPTLPDGLPAFAPDAEVRATLRGPSFTEAQELVVTPNTPFSIPPLTVPGIHTLENIRLTSHGEILLRAIPESVVIEVIDKLLVTQVTARPLTAAEIREKGIVFDSSSFQAYNFTAAFAIQDQHITINFPVVLPQIQAAEPPSVNQVAVPQIATPALPSLKTIIPDTLKLQTQIPNLSVVGFTLKVPTLAGQDLFVPPIPGVIVIPGNIGFLNQFFSVNLMVGNLAPAGSNLIVSDLLAEIVLPVGDDQIAGTADDPLRMARTATGESPRVRLVVQPGPDGQLGTADDIATLGPGETGNAEYLVEGLREGSHVIEIAMSGTLHGLPVGDVVISGRAAGSVLVRNPAFSLTFTHPEVVSAGEPYTLDVTVTNTSTSPANFVSLNLYPRNVSGATIVGSNTREIDSISPGDSATVTFDMVSSLSGRVTAATIDSADNVTGRFQLKTSVGELGVPLSPDSLVLPKEANALPKSLRDAAIGLLGKAWAVATAPPAALPKDVQRFSKQIVLDRAVEVAEAGFRVSLHEPLGDSAAQLAMDVLGNKYSWLPQTNARPDDLAFARNDFSGFDGLRRQSVRGDRFADAVAAILASALAAKGAQAFHADLASKWSYRPLHISALVAGSGGRLPYRISLVDALGRRVGGAGADGKVVKQIPYGDLLTFGMSGAGGEMAVLASPDPGVYTVRLDRVDGVADGEPYVLSLVLPDPAGGLRHLTFQAAAGQSVPVVQASADPYQLRIEVHDGSAVGSGAPIGPDVSAIVNPPPTILGAVQQLDADTIRCDPDSLGTPVGRVVAVLFSEEVTAESVQDKVKPESITNYRIDGNQVVSVALQPGRRIAFLALRDPYGPFVQRQLTASNVSDVNGRAMPPATIPIESTMGNDGGVISGRVLHADGTPVPFANVRLFYLQQCDDDPHWVGISSKSADVNGNYGWDFVSNQFADRIVAIDGETGDSRDLQFSVQRGGQRLNVDVVFLGRGTFKGRTLAEDGRALANTSVRVTSLTDNSQFGATTDADGRFEIGRIPVGNLLVEAVNSVARAQFFFSDVIPFPGAVTARDITLLDGATRDVTIKNGTIRGFVYKPDSVTPIAGAPVIAYYRNRSQKDVPCPEIGVPPAEPPECAVAVMTSGLDGAFRFDKVPAGELRLYAFDQASLSQGNAGVVLAPDSVRFVNVVLVGGLGTVTGRVVDPAGAAVAGARVGGGFTLATTDALGNFTMTDVPVGHRDIVAVSHALGTSGTVGIDIVRDGEQVSVTIVLESVGSVAGRVVHADGITPAANRQVYVFRQTRGQDGPQIQIVGTATTDAAGTYRIDRLPMGSFDLSVFEPDFSDGNIGKVVLKFHQQVFRGDIVYRGGGGSVHGAVFDADGRTPLKARLGLSGDQVVVAAGQVGVAFQYVENYRIVDTDFSSGQYSFSGLWVGGFTLRAVGQFSPDPIAVEGAISTPNESVELNLTLQATSQVGGTVYEPDGVTPVGENVVVSFKSEAFKMFCTEDAFGEDSCVTIPQGIQSMNAVTDSHGRFFFPIVNAGAFKLTAEDPATGKSARISGTVKAGQAADLSMRLLGIADLIVQVFGSDTTTPIPNARVEVQQIAYPQQKRTLIAGPSGVASFTGGDAFSEGELTVAATDQSTGFSGRAPAKVVKDGQTVTVKVYLFNATGTVFGTVFQQDGIAPVPNADIVVSNAAGPIAFSVTGADGSYRLTGVPLGDFTVDTFEGATARRASRSGNIPLPDQEIPVNLVLAAIGVVKGTLVEGGSLTALKGWEITLNQVSQSGRALPTLKTTTSVDGTWSFPGTSRGTFTVFARKPDVQGTTSASGTIEREGQIVDVPLVVDSLRPLAGRVEGTVFSPDGTRAANSIVEICYAGRCTGDVPPVRVTADTQGAYFLDAVPLGRFSVTAHSQTTQDVGRRYGDMELDGDIVTADVALVGVTEIDGVVMRSDGSRAVTALVKLDGSPATGCDGTCTVGVNPADGTFAFLDVPARTFTIRAQDPVTGLKGSVGGTLNPGEHKAVTVVLEPTGTVSGRVLRASGQPAQGVVAELVLSPDSQAERRLYLESGSDGQFTFDSASIGSFTLNLTDPAGSGLARRIGTVGANSALGDIVLDEAPPAVASTSPAAGAVGVPLNQVVRVVFTEPILPGTVDASSVLLEGPTGTVATIVNVVEGDTVATLTPISPLKDETRFTVRADGVKDRVGKTMAARFTSTFTTLDITPPSFVSISPAPGSNGVPIYTPVRIQFSEPIDPTKFRGPPIAMTGPQGAVTGRIDYTLGNTVLVFTPNLPLSEATVYHVVTSAAGDSTGNMQAQDLDYTFSTTDRTPPQILGLKADHNGTVIENTVATVSADVGTSHDVAFVDWYLNDVFTFTGRTAPFVFAFKANTNLGGPGSQIKVSAIATDTSGNRGTSAVSIPVTVLADQPPSVIIASPAGSPSARNGDRIDVRIDATDDVGLTRVGYKAHTGQPQDAATRTFDPAAPTRSESFAFNVPTDVAPGSTILVEASGVDTAGHVVHAAPVSVTVVDAVNPTVTITGTTSGTKVNPGQTTTAIVSAEDLGGVASITFTVGGGLTAVQTRTIDPAQNAVAASFSIQVPSNLQPGQTLTLDATATDRAGNRGTAARVILPVADTVPPTVRLTSATGSLEMVKGQPFTVIADAEDEIALARVELAGQGAFTVSDAKPVSPPLGSAHVPFTINVPDTLDPGAILSLRATAVDTSGNVSSPALLTLSVKALTGVTLPPSTIVIAGESVPVTVQLADPAPSTGLRVDFTSADGTIASVTPSLQFNAGETTRTVQITGVSGGSTSIRAFVQGVQRTSMTATVRGGIVGGSVFSASLQPASGVQLTINSIVATATDAGGDYFVEGVAGPSVVVKAFDPVSGQRGFATASMNRANGFVTVNLILVPAGAVRGDVKTAANTPAGAGVKIELFAANDLSSPQQLAFTDDASTYEFPVVTPGGYVLVATSTDGHRGRATVTVGTSGNEETVPIAFLGEGSVVGTVRDGAGAAVPRASLAFQTFTVFGSAPAISISAEADGTFRFDRVLIGNFTVQALDNVTGQGGSTSGAITDNGQTVTADVHLSTFGNVTGVVRRPDGVTVAVGALVTVGGRSTLTNDRGEYTVSFLPLGPFTVTVNDQGTRQQGRATGTLTTQGETKTVDVTLHPQGTLIVHVNDAGGQPVPSATVSVFASDGGFSDVLGGTTGPDGSLILEHLLSGSIQVNASAGVLRGNTATTLAADEVKQVTVALEATGTIAGVIYEPDGRTPAVGARVTTANQTATTGDNGAYRFDGLPLTTTYSIVVFDSLGRTRAKTKTPIALPIAPSVVTRDFTMVGIGTVTGRVLNPDSSSAPNLVVTVRSFNADFGGTRSAITNAGGFYTVDSVPVGAVSVSTGDVSRLLLGEGSGTLANHGDTLTIDVLLVSNAVTPPVLLWDANNYAADIQRDGTLATGTNAFRNQGGLALDIVSGGVPARFEGTTIATIENGGREIAVRQQALAGLNVTRKIAVPRNGYFARYLDILSNPTPQPVTVDVRVTSQLRQTLIWVTSSGDNALDVGAPDTADRWIVVDDSVDAETGVPATAFVFDGLGGAQRVGSATTSTTSPLDLTFEWRSVTVPANGSLAYLYFVAQQTSRAAAQASAERLVQLPPEALDGLSLDEIAQIANFAVPADGSSPVPVPPSLLGSVDGRVLASDTATAIAGSVVHFRSANPLFARSSQTTTGQDGRFVFAGSLNDSGTSRAIAVDAFTLQADHPGAPSVIQSPRVDATFQAGSSTTTQDVVFSNTGFVGGTVRLNGAAAGGASVVASGAVGNGNFSLATQSAGDGSYLFTLIPAGGVTVRATAQGTTASATTSTVVTAGSTLKTDLAIDSIAPQVSIVSPPAGAQIDPRTPLDVTVTASDQGGVAAVGLSTSGVVVRTETRGAPVTATRTEVFTVPFESPLPTGGSLTLAVTALDAAGNQAAATRTVSVLDVVPPNVRAITPVDGAVNVEPTASLVVQFSEPIDRASATATSMRLSRGQTGVALEFSFSNGDRTVTLTPVQPLAFGAAHTVVVDTGVRDVAGNPMTTAVTSAFTTKPEPATLTQLIPASGRQFQTLDVTITGSATHFLQGVTSANFGGSIVVNLLTVNSATSATANISIQPVATVGARTVTLTTGDEQASLTNGFTVLPGLPTLTNVNPNIGHQGETLTSVNLTGLFTNWAQGTTTANFGPGITVNSVTVSSKTSASANISVDPVASTGSRTVTTTTGAELATLNGGFTVTPGVPALLSLNPNAGTQGTNATVIITGAFTTFTQGATTASFGSGITVGTVTVNGPTLASVPISIGVGAIIGPRTVTVTTGTESASLVNGFSVLQGTPSIAVINPNVGRPNTVIPVSIQGVFTNWQTGVTQASFGAGISVGGGAAGVPGPIVVNGQTSITANLSIDAAAALGVRDVTVQTGTDVLTVPAGFTVSTADTTPPTVLTVSPASGATGVPLNVALTVEFNEPMERTTITTSTFKLFDGVTGLIVPATVSVDPTGRITTLVPSQLLPVNRFHSFQLIGGANGIKDQSGNALSFTNQFSFTTGFSTDTTGPTLTVASPQAGDTGIAINTKINLFFDKPVNPITRTAGLTVLQGATPVPGTYAFSNNNQRVTFTPTTNFAAGTTFSVVLESDLTDTSGDPLTNPQTVSFTTGSATDTTAPTVTFFSPASNEVNVPRNIVIRVAFSKPIDSGTVTRTTFRLLHSGTGQEQMTTVLVAADRRSATLVPTSPLLADTQYFYQLVSFQDVAGNTGSLGSVSFTTGSAIDSTAPVVVSVAPVDAAGGVGTNARVVYRFNEPVDAATVPQAIVQLTPSAAGALALSTDNKTLTFTPAANLTASAAYTAQLAGLRDKAGNLMTPFSSTFTTAAATDTTAPTVTSIVPASGTTGVSQNAPIVITISEPIVASQVDADSVFIRIETGSFARLAGTYTLNASNTQITFTPAQPYPPATPISVRTNQNSAIKDLAGNNLQNLFAQFTTGSAITDTTPPVVTSVTPTNGTTDAGQNITVVLTFSESLDPNTIGSNTFTLFAGSTELSPNVQHSSDNRTVTLQTTLPALSTITVVATSGVQDLAGNALADFASTFSTGQAVEAGRPTIVTQRPGNGATGVPANSTITLFANESLDPSTLAGAVRVAQNGILVAGALGVSATGEAIQFTPSGSFAFGALVQIFVDSTALDLQGNSLNSYSGQFTVASDPLTIVPSVVRLSPTSGASGVPRNPTIEVEFSEPLDPATVNVANISVRDNTFSTVIPSAITLVGGGKIVRIVPDATLAANLGHFVRVTTGLHDVQGTPLNFPQNFSFTTGATSDSTAPTATIVMPPDGQTNVGVNTLIRVTFSELVNELSVSDTTIHLSDGAFQAMAASISFTAVAAPPGTTVATITPLEPLPDNTSMTLTIDGVKDLAGNAVTLRTTQFTTGAIADTVPPVVSSFSVLNGATGVPINSVFTIEMSEPVDVESLTSTAVRILDNVTGQQVPAAVTLSSDGRTLTLAPSVPLPAGRSLLIQVNSLQDFSGNVMAGVNDFFTTAFTVDTTPPIVLTTSPAASVTGVATNTQVQVQFNEPVRPESLALVQLLAGVKPKTVTMTLSDANRLLTMTPDSLLAANTAHTISIAGAQDLSGNTLAGTVTVPFTTGPGTDLLNPTVVSSSPSSGDTKVPRNVVVRFLFSEPVNPLSISAGFRLLHSATGQTVPATLAFAPNGRGLSLTPSAPLLPQTSYNVAGANIRDLAGNPVSFGSMSFTTSAAVDTTGPTVTSIAPSNVASGVPVNGHVLAVMSEKIDRTSFTTSSLQVTPGPVPGTLTLDATDGVTLTFVPSANLAVSTVYTVTISGLRGPADNVMAPFVSTFTTGASATPDTTAPVVTSITPINGASGVAVTSPIVITLSEPVTASQVDADSVFIREEAGLFARIAGSYSVNLAATQITFTPAAPYPAATTISVRANSNATIKDLAGNNLTNSFTQFTTANTVDATAPTVLSVTPINGATGAGTSTVATLVFSESLNPNTITSSTFGLFAGSLQLGTNVGHSSDDRTVTLSATLPANSLITVVATGGVQDLSGNALAPLFSQFTTGPDTQNTAPTITSQRPANGATGVPTNTTVTLFSSEPLSPSTVPAAVRVTQNGTPIAGGVTVSAGGSAIQFTPAADLLPGAFIQVFVDTTALDLAGNPLTGYSGQFTVASDPLTTVPSVVRLSPTSGATGVPRNPTIEVEFSEPLDPVTVNVANISLRDNTLSTVIPSTITLVGGGNIVRIVPDATLAANLVHFVRVTTGLHDVQGTPLNFAQNFSFTTGAGSDSSAPTVTGLAPPNGQTDVGVNALIRATFSEPVNPISVSGSTLQVTGPSFTAVPTNISFDSTGMQVTITPLEPLPDNQAVTISINGVKDLAGNAVTPQSTVFQTRTGIDSVRPSFNVNVLSGDSAVPVNSFFSIVFSEPIDVQTVTTTSVRILDTTFQTSVVPVTYFFDSHARTVLLTPTANLPAAHSMLLVVNGVQDLAGNIASGGNSSFTTSSVSDTTAPSIIGFSLGAADGTSSLSNVPINSNIQFQFSETMRPVTVDFVSLSAGSSVPITVSMSNGNRTLTITPSVLLSPNTTYSVQLLSSGVRDVAGNPLPGDSFAYTFTTGATADFVRPTSPPVYSPADLTINVPVAVAPTVTFNEAINPVNIIANNGSSGVQLVVTATGVNVPVTFGFSTNLRTVTLTPVSPLANNTQYTIRVNSPTADLAGNTIGTFTTARFTTVP